MLLPAEGLSATTFSLLPPAVSAGGEIALTLVLATETPGLAGLQILLGGEPLGQAVSINTEGSASGTGVGAVFTRTLPPDLTSGSYLIEIVASQQPSQVLASGTIEVVADPPDALVEPADAAPPPTGNQLPGLTVALAIGGATAVVGAGFGFSARFRRKEIVRRLSQKSL